MDHKRKTKILFVHPTSARGGIETMLHTLVRTLDHDRFDLHVIVLEPGALVRELREAGAHVSVFPITRLRHIGNTTCTVLRIAHYIRQHQIDVVHCNSPKSQIYGSLAAALARTPNVYWLHGILSPRIGVDIMGDIALLLPSSLLLTNSEVTSCMTSQHPCVRCKPQILWPGIELRPYTNRTPASFGTGVPRPGQKRILSIGRIQAWKGQHVVIQAAHVLKARRNDLHFDIVGSPTFASDMPYYDSLTALIHDLDVADIIDFVRQLADPTPWYRAADIVVLTSVKPESFGLVLVEALACGRPVIATNMGGPVEITDNGTVGGLLVPPNDPQALADAILFLLDHPVEAARRAEAGRQRVQALYSAERMAAAAQAIYERLAR